MDDLEVMDISDIDAYFSPENYRHMFSLAETPCADDLAELALYAIDLKRTAEAEARHD